MKKLNLLLLSFYKKRYGWIMPKKKRLRFTGNCWRQEFTTFTPKNVLNLFTAFELDIWSQDVNAKFTLRYCLFGAVKLSKNNDHTKYSYSGYGIGFDSHSLLYLIPYFQ